MTIYYCLHKGTKKPVLAGRVPEVWGNISGLKDVSGEALIDLTWAGYPDHGFFTEKEAMDFGASSSDLAASLAIAAEEEGRVVRKERNRRLSECDWTQAPDATGDKAAWASYRTALRDISSQPGFPWSFTWPDEP